MRQLLFLLLFAAFSATSIELPADTPEHIYGIGSDTSYDLAQKAAMADIVMKLATRVNASTQISQTKSNTKTQVNAQSRVIAESRGIELPNVDVIDSEQTQGRWQVVVRVERDQVKRSIKHQLDTLNSDLRFTLEEFENHYAPSCFYALSNEESKITQLKELIPAYIGIGSEKGAEAPFYSTINIFERTYKRCKKRNRYTLTFSKPVSSVLESSTKAQLKENGFEVVSRGENTGNVQFNIKTKSSYFNKTHLTILTTEILVFDENESLKFKDSFKVKGASFKSSNESVAKAELALLQRVKLK